MMAGNVPYIVSQIVVHQTHGDNFHYITSYIYIYIYITIPSVYFRTTFRNSEVLICGTFQDNNLKIVLHLTKTETSVVTWLNIVTIVARSIRLLPAHIHKQVHATRQLHCQ